MKTIPNFLRNANLIVEIAKQLDILFKPRVGENTHESIIPGLYSKFKTLYSRDMPDSLIDIIFKESDFDDFLKYSFNFIQIQKYEEGDFIVPHKDLYSIQKLHLVTLTTSDIDGLVIEDGNHGLLKIKDVAGQKILLNDEYHWVDPVHHLRYSLVVGE